MTSTLRILKTSFLISLLWASQPVQASGQEEVALPAITVKIYAGKGSHNTETINLRNTYRQSPLLGILYVPQDTKANSKRLDKFHQDFVERDKYIQPDEQVSRNAHCLFMTAKPDGDLQELIGMIKPAGGFSLASDNGALLAGLGLDPKSPWLILFRNGLLLWKERIAEKGEIPHF